MQIDINALKYNLIKFRSMIATSIKLMMMIKAWAYGAGVKQIGRWAQQTQMIDYLAVAFLAEEQTFPCIHVKLNTGMNRLGLNIDEIPAFLSILSSCICCRLTIQSIYSHVAASDDPEEDDYTAEQERLFLASTRSLEDGIAYPVLKHLCNSMGVLRHPHLHFDMVRVGGGLYGAAACFEPYLSPLLPAISLMSSIAQVRKVKKGATIGYNRRGRVDRDSVIGILRIGYADGLKRKIGNGQGQVWVRNCLVPYIGSICMDFAMIDLTDVPVENEYELENESVEIFGKHINVEEVARWCDTIVFEFISTISRRVHRSYINDEGAKTLMNN